MANVSNSGVPIIWVVIAIIAVAAGVYMYAPAAPAGGLDNDTATALSIVPDPAEAASVASVGSLAVDATFGTLNATNNASGVVTLADIDSTNYDTDTKVISLQVDVDIDSTTTAGYTVFTMKARNDTGIATPLMVVNDTGTLTSPTTSMTQLVTLQLTESVISGFATRDSIITQMISASAPMLKDTAGELYSPIVVQTTNTKIPELKVDGTKDSHSYPWLIDTLPRTVDVTFSLDAVEILKMTDISIVEPVTIEMPGSDDVRYTINIIRNAAI